MSSLSAFLFLHSNIYIMPKFGSQASRGKSVPQISMLIEQELTDTNGNYKQWRQPLKWHLTLLGEHPDSCVLRCLFMFFFSCLVPHISQIMCWSQDWRWALRHYSLLKCLKQPNSEQTASTESNLVAMGRAFIRVRKQKLEKF